MLRDGEPKTLTVTVGSQQVDRVAAAPAPAREHAQGKLGISVGNVSDPQVRQELRLQDSTKDGVVVREVLPGSPAAEAGLQSKDILIRINGKRITSAEQVSQIVAGLPAGESVPVVIHREDRSGVSTILAIIKLD